MSQIKRSLKRVDWVFDSESKELTLVVKYPRASEVTLTKTELFSLARFLIRAMQKMSVKKRNK